MKITPRERQVVDLIADGLSSREIATKLGIALATVEVHRYNLHRRFGTHNVVSLLTAIEQAKLMQELIS